jgi:hypothetical protein
MLLRGERVRASAQDTVPSDVPKGWYPMPDGRHRYWDGKRWTENFSTQPPSPKQHARRMRNLTWLAWAVGLCLVLVLGVSVVRILHLETQQEQLVDQLRRDIENVRP